jgi:hypothetical protein
VQREIIDSQLRRRLTHAEVLVPQQTASSIWSGRQTGSARESGSSFTASTLGERQQEAGRFLRPAPIAPQQPREALRKDLSRATGFIAEKPPRPNA